MSDKESGEVVHTSSSIIDRALCRLLGHTWTTIAIAASGKSSLEVCTVCGAFREGGVSVDE